MLRVTQSGIECSVDLHTLGEDEATQTPQQRQAAELIDAAKEVFAFSGQSPQTLTHMLMLPVSADNPCVRVCDRHMQHASAQCSVRCHGRRVTQPVWCRL